MKKSYAVTVTFTYNFDIYNERMTFKERKQAVLSYWNHKLDSWDPDSNGDDNEITLADFEFIDITPTENADASR